MAQPEKVVPIDPLSLRSLYLKLYFKKLHLGYGTGFVVAQDNRLFLITAGHVLTGREAVSGKPLCKETAALPDQVRIGHHKQSKLGKWRFEREALYDDDGRPRWLAHPDGHKVDVVALELTKTSSDVKLHPLDLELADVDLQVYPGMSVQIIGFALGLRPNVLFPVWKTGHIASDPDLDYDHRPAFLIDATTRKGMSGSPVIARAHGGYLTRNRIWVMGGVETRFLGVYSGRIHDDAEIGIVWRPHVIAEILAFGSRPADNFAS